MTKYIPIYLLAALVALGAMASCNSKDDEPAEETAIAYSNVAVTSFKLSKNDSVVAYLDSVYFAIDLNNAVIFNADSLPKGTDVSRLVLQIGLPTVQEAVLIEPAAAGGEDREIDYVNNSTDSIDFSHGDVKLRVVSYDGELSRTYTIKVNVHRVESDSLCWNKMALATLPGGLANPTEQKTVELDSRAYCLVSDGAAARVSVSADPADVDSWTTTDANLPAGARVSTLTASGSSLYLLDEANALWQSADGVDWTDAGASFSWLYGDFDGELVAVDPAGGVKCYPSMRSVDAPASMPVSGTSAMLVYTTEWSTEPFAMLIGGVDAQGNTSPYAWGFDGNSWVKLNTVPFDAEGLADMTIVPYFSFKTNSKTWAVTSYSTILAFGGRRADGTCSRTMYVSLDRGLHWSQAVDLLQLPTFIPAMSSSQALVFPSTLTARSGGSDGSWREFSALKLPPWLMIERSAGSRATAPITEWECPYIYLFGGVDSEGRLCNTLWRGVINRLTFKPLQ